MPTVVENLSEMAERAKGHLRELLTCHSSIHHEPYKTWQSRSMVGLSGGVHEWNDLPPEGSQLQARALDEYRRYAAVVGVLLRGQPRNTLKDLRQHEKFILAAIEQDSEPQGRTPDDVLAGAVEALDAQAALVANLYDASGGEPVYVPDTNALVLNPQLEDWRFDGAARFTMFFLPTVLQELDALKVNHRVESVRDKSEGLIHRIKGYRARGRLSDGVPLTKGVSTLIAGAVEPDMGNTLSWLDAANNDDRVLAGFIEVMRRYPHSPVTLVTGDLNLQNKAEYAGLPFAEPPAPAAIP